MLLELLDSPAVSVGDPSYHRVDTDRLRTYFNLSTSRTALRTGNTRSVRPRPTTSLLAEARLAGAAKGQPSPAQQPGGAHCSWPCFTE